MVVAALPVFIEMANMFLLGEHVPAWYIVLFARLHVFVMCLFVRVTVGCLFFCLILQADLAIVSCVSRVVSSVLL